MSQGCAIFHTLNEQFGKMYHSKLETLVWRHHIGVLLWYTKMAAGNQWKHLEITLAYLKRFLLCAELANIRMYISLYMLAVQTSKT